MSNNTTLAAVRNEHEGTPSLIPYIPNEAEFENIKRICFMAAQSGLLKSNRKPDDITGKTADAMFVAFYGLERGISVITALRHFNVVNGNIGTDGQMIISLMKRAGYEVVVPNPGEVTVEATVKCRQGDGEWHSYTFTEEMAIRAGLINGDSKAWRHYKPVMMIWRAVAMMGRYEGGALLGIPHLTEELSENVIVDEGGVLIGYDNAPALPEKTGRVETVLNPPERKRIDTAPKPEPTAERWWHDPDSGNVFLNNSLEEGADTVNLNGPYDSKAEADAAKATFTAPAESPALTPEPAADKAFNEIPSMNEGKPSTLDSDEGYMPYTFDRVRLVDKPGGKGFMYILTQLRRGDNPTLFEGKLLRDVGLPVDAWKKDGKGVYVLPGTYTALATFDKQKQAWHVKHIDAPANAQNAPELPVNAAEIPF